MTVMRPLTVTITTAPHPDLTGTVTFKHPTVYDHLAIGRRATELANTGASAGAPRISVADLPIRQQQSCYMIATLEHTITSAPKGFYATDPGNGHPVLDLGQLDESDADSEGSLLDHLYAAYLAWRSDFRRERARPAE